MINGRRGASVLSIAVAVVVMLIILSTVTFSALNNIKIRKLDNLYNDIRILKEKVELYYMKYGKLPLGEEYNEIGTVPAEILNPNDGDNYYIININALGNLTLSTYIDERRFFVINEQSHTIYYPQGVELDGKIYFALPEEYTYIQ